MSDKRTEEAEAIREAAYIIDFWMDDPDNLVDKLMDAANDLDRMLLEDESEETLP